MKNAGIGCFVKIEIKHSVGVGLDRPAGDERNVWCSIRGLVKTKPYRTMALCYGFSKQGKLWFPIIPLFPRKQTVSCRKTVGTALAAVQQ